MDREHHLCDGFFLNLSENNSDSTDKWRFKIDGSFISNEDREQTEFGRPNWHLQEILIEFKKGGENLDPFTGKPGEELRKREEGSLSARTCQRVHRACKRARNTATSFVKLSNAVLMESRNMILKPGRL